MPKQKGRPVVPDIETAPLWGEIVSGVPYPMSVEEFERRYLGQHGYELFEGRVIHGMNTKLHALVSSRILATLIAYTQQQGGFQAFGADDTYKLNIPGQPRQAILVTDASVVALSKLPPLTDLRAWDAIAQTPPDLAVEIASQGQTSATMGRKAQQFLAAGTRLVWVI